MAFLDNINITDILWILVLISFLIPQMQKRMLLIKRRVIMRSIETKRNSCEISTIHRQEEHRDTIPQFPYSRLLSSQTLTGMTRHSFLEISDADGSI